MHITTHFYEEFPETQIVASTVRQGDFATLVFKQQRAGGDQINIHLPDRMHSCLETIARVFNECMEGGALVSVPDCTQPDTPPELGVVRADGQYIGLTRGYDEDVPIGGLTSKGDIRGPDDGPARTFITGGVVLVLPEVAIDAARFGWTLAPSGSQDGLIAIERPTR